MLTGSFSVFRLPGITAGPNEFLEIITDTIQLVSCTEIVTLRAQIITNDPGAGHTYFWQQIAGPTVTWLEPQNQLLVTFQKPSTTEDLVFRFWVDRYTPFQQYKDTYITPTAREDLIYAISIQNSGFISISDPTSSSMYMSPISTNTINLIPTSPATNGYVYNTTDLTISWTNPTPTYPVVYKRSELYIVTGSVLTLVATFNNPIYTYQNLLIGQPNRTNTYMFRSYWDLYNVGQFTGYVDSSTFTFSPINDISIRENADNTAITIQNSAIVDYFQVQILSLVNLEYTDTSNYAIDIQNSGSVDYFQIQILSLINLPDILQDTPNYALNIEVSGNITIFQVQSIGAITIL